MDAATGDHASKSGKEQLSATGEPQRLTGDIPSLMPVHHQELVAKEITDGSEADDIDETLYERLWGLTEMFPERLRNVVGNSAYFGILSGKFMFTATKYLSWFVASTACIMVLPVMIESERSQMEEQHLQQQRQILLGPSAAVSAQQNRLGQL